MAAGITSRKGTRTSGNLTMQWLGRAEGSSAGQSVGGARHRISEHDFADSCEAASQEKVSTPLQGSRVKLLRGCCSACLSCTSDNLPQAAVVVARKKQFVPTIASEENRPGPVHKCKPDTLRPKSSQVANPWSRPYKHLESRCTCRLHPWGTLAVEVR